MPGGRSPRKRLPLVRPWRQERSAATVQRLAAATMKLLKERDFDAISVDEIVRAARTSKGSFYFRFATKADLLRFLAEDMFTALSRESRAFFDAERNRRLPLAPFLDAFIDLVGDVYAGRRNLLRAFMREARPGGDDVIVALVRTGSAESARQLVEALRSRMGEIKHPAPDVAVVMAVMVLGGLLRQALLFPEQSSLFPAASGDLFRRELRRMVESYLKN